MDWIKASEELPDDCEIVISAYPLDLVEYSYDFMVFLEGEFINANGNKSPEPISHWARLTPPKGEA